MTEYSPNAVFDNNSPKAINKKNIERLHQNGNPDDTVTIAFIGDSQRFYDEVEKFTAAVNTRPGVDLVIIAGDISDFGLLAEFEWITKRLDKLKRPYIGVVGNHDVLANGEAVFQRMFGPLNDSFVYDGIRFVLHNTNSREYLSENVPDLAWLETQLAPDAEARFTIAVSHVPPYDKDFNRNLEKRYHELFVNTPGFLLSLHGHIHRHTDGFPYDDGIRYITSHYLEERQFTLLKIHNGEVLKEVIKY